MEPSQHYNIVQHSCTSVIHRSSEYMKLPTVRLLTRQLHNTYTLLESQ